MEQYLDLLKETLNYGEKRSDRTGTGTISLFGLQRSYDLRDGFPLVTTKKVFTKGIIHELLGMLKGDTNIKYLNENGVHIWDEWAKPSGELGHIYLNHVEQVKEQLSREPFALPKLELNPNVRNIFDFKYEDIKIVNYNCHPAIKGEVAV